MGLGLIAATACLALNSYAIVYSHHNATNCLNIKLRIIAYTTLHFMAVVLIDILNYGIQRRRIVQAKG